MTPEKNIKEWAAIQRSDKCIVVGLFVILEFRPQSAINDVTEVHRKTIGMLTV